ncbi:MAG: ABC transporter ATP-binding protein [Clostridia bacterium]|nr:ABC transporter ATP-binding protein [Clostridia bacterium]
MDIRISKTYGERVVLDDLALAINEGEILCVLGDSGTGKTTLLNILAGLIDFTGEIEGASDRVGYIFQEPRLLANLTVAENLAYVGADEREIEHMLEKVEISDCRNKRPCALSGGEKQRVAIARAFLSNAPLLLLDEPFVSLDTSLKIRLYRVFARLWEERKPTAVLVTHDIEEAWSLGHRVVVLRDGKIVFDVRTGHTTLPVFGEQSEKKKALLKVLLGGDQDE